MPWSRLVEYAGLGNEWLCLRLPKAYGLAVANARIATFGRRCVLVVERFDRRVAPKGQWLMRLPQEDFCQVEGCSPLRKYENDGGPGLKALFGTLRQSVNAEAGMKTLMAAQVLFWLPAPPQRPLPKHKPSCRKTFHRVWPTSFWTA